MEIRRSEISDQEEISTLIKSTIENVNRLDYSDEQIAKWSGNIDAARMKDRFNSIVQYVATLDDQIIGIGDINADKCEVDFLYVHHDYIGKGVGTRLMNKLEKDAVESGISTLRVTASITSLPFFTKLGYQVHQETQKELDGVEFRVFLMEKQLDRTS